METAFTDCLHMQTVKQDTAALWLSGLCIVHCIAAPVVFLLAGTGLLTTAFTSEWVHVLLFVPMLVLIGSTVFKSAKRYQYRTPLKLAAIGMLILLASLSVHGPIESVMGIIGGSLVFIAHWKNRRFLKAQFHDSALS